MKLNSAFVWAIVTIALVAASFLLGSITKNTPSEKTADNELQEKTEEIQILKQKIDQLTEELISRGIFSYPQGNVISKEQDSLAAILITLNGNEPVQDLEVSRSLIYNYSNLTKEQFEELLLRKETTDLGTLKAHNPAVFDVPVKQDEAAIRLRFDSHDDHWIQYIRIKKSANGELKSFWVITNRDSEVIDKHLDEGFPVNEDGEVVLWQDRSVSYSDLEMNSIFRL